EIKRYPELTEKTARFPAKYNEPAHRNGYYTQQQMKDLVKYAADRNIEITPEIEMPGHSLSVFACYPELSCTGEPVELYPFYQGSNITEDVFCAGNEAVFGFLKNVLAEVAEIFPSKYIHIGGDEAPTTHWESCSKCQVRMKQENLSDEHALQGYFMNRMAEYVNSIGKQMIGWDEIIEGELPPNSTLMWWRGRNQAGLTAAEAGHDVIMSPRSHCYFDYTYQTLSTRTCYSFEPIPKELSAGKEKPVLGLQANFWSAVDREPDQVDRQLWPRLLAIAERGWSEKTVRDWEDFSRRVEAALPRLAELGVAYHPETKKIQIGKWATGDVTEEYAPLTFDITENLSGSEP
ncbi:MAG: family 20 glycosylhydrolase, partial [Deltaproteobacteria bacterium]|nr:family 20 glycosylhydrolase [Deltaproteobacteria bacterium]